MNTLPTVTALVPAAGDSTRMGRAISKALMMLGGETVLERCVRTVLESRYLETIVVLCRDQDRGHFIELLAKHPKVRVELGGVTRQESVAKGLRAISAQKPDFVLVHDVARCLVSCELIDRCIESAFEREAVTAAIPLVDTVKRVSGDGVVEATLDRKGLVLVQTPQVFRFDLLRRAHESGLDGVTDDAALVESLTEVHMVPGEPFNIKLTNQSDIQLAEAMLRTKGDF